MPTRTLFALAAALALSGSSVAALAASSTSSSMASSSSMTAAKPNAAEVKFVTDVLMGDNAEIMVGELAMSKGSSQAAKDFGQTLVNDHRQNRETLMPIATKLGVKVSATAVTAADKAEYTKLRGLSGAAFDKELGTAMVKGHKMMIAMFTPEAKKTDDVGAFVKASLPVLNKHLQLAQALAGGAASTTTTTKTNSSSAASSSSAM